MRCRSKILRGFGVALIAASLMQTITFTSMGLESSGYEPSSQTQQAPATSTGEDTADASGTSQSTEELNGMPEHSDASQAEETDGNSSNAAGGAVAESGNSSTGNSSEELSSETSENQDAASGKDEESGSVAENENKDLQGWVEGITGEKHWYDSGVEAKNKQIWDPQTDAWYQLDGNGNIVKGEYWERKTDAWYHFDETSGAMTKGMAYIHAPEGWKWVYYDVITGVMAHGQRYLDYDAEHTGWYLFDHYTGAVTYGWAYIRNQNKWVYNGIPDGKMRKGEQAIDGAWYYFNDITGATLYGWQFIHGKQVFYDRVTGKMAHGPLKIDGKPYYFDDYTGRKFTRNDLIYRLLQQARSSYGKNIDAPGVLAANGGLICPYGPCMAWVWWVFHEAGLGIFLCDGAATGWPHHNYDWYRVRGRVSMTPQVGDIAFYKWPGWANNLSASHAAIVVAVNGRSVTVADAMAGGIGERPSYTYVLVGYAHPYWD